MVLAPQWCSWPLSGIFPLSCVPGPSVVFLFLIGGSGPSLVSLVSQWCPWSLSDIFFCPFVVSMVPQWYFCSVVVVLVPQWCPWSLSGSFCSSVVVLVPQ